MSLSILGGPGLATCLKNLAWLVLEKIPLLGYRRGLWRRHSLGAVRRLNPHRSEPLVVVRGNAMLSYVEYLGRLFYPVHLAVPYPHRYTHLPVWEVLGPRCFWPGVTAAAVAAWRKYPYGTVGWLWYLGMMVPVIGLIELARRRNPIASPICRRSASAWRWRGA